MKMNFYRQFEDRHRGSRDLILSRLKVYLPFINPLIKMQGPHHAIDLGCGRGEWLEILKHAGFAAEGVDLDEGMLAACRERGFNVRCQDAISALKKLSSSSQKVVSGFHLAEHLAFADLQELVAESFRVLQDGGLLILETPNPENVLVGSSNFYLDPSHHHPLPPLLLSFLPEFYGFDRVKVVRLQESINQQSTRTLTIHDVLGGVSPDYAVIAQKQYASFNNGALENAFELDYGVSLADVAKLYEDQSLNQYVSISTRIDQISTRIDQISTRIDQQDHEIQIIKNNLREHDQLFSIFDARLCALEKILRPLLWINHQYQLLQKDGVKIRAKLFLKKVIRLSLTPLRSLIRKFPKFHKAIIWILVKIGIYDAMFRPLKPIMNPENSVLPERRNITQEEENVKKILKLEPSVTQKLYAELSRQIDRGE